MTVLGGVGWSTLRVWGSRLTGLGTFLVLARLVRPEDLGLVALITAYLSIMNIIAEGGLADYIIQRDYDDPEQDSAIFALQTTIGAAFGAFLFLMAPLIAPLMVVHPNSVKIFQVAALAVPCVAVIRVPEALLRKRLQFRILAYRGLVTIIVGGVAGISLALLGYGVWALIWKVVVEAVADMVLIFAASRWWPGRSWTPGVLRTPLRYGINLLGAKLLDALNHRVDTFIVGHFFGQAALGFYATGQKLFHVLMELFSGVANQVAVPYLSRSKSSRHHLISLYLGFIKASGVLVIPAFAVVSVSSSLIVPWLFGDVWLESASILTIFALVGAINGVSFFNGTILLAVGDSSAYFRALLAKTIINTCLCLLGAMSGMTSVAMGVAAQSVVMAPMVFRSAKKWTGVDALTFFRATAPGVGLGLALMVTSLGVLKVSEPLSASFQILILAISVIGFYSVAFLFLGGRALLKFGD